MFVVIRADASVQIGTGHVMRCLTLAYLLREAGARIVFICRELPGNLCKLIEEKGYCVYRLPCGDSNKTFAQDNSSIDDIHVVSWEQDAEETGQILDRIGEKIDWLIVDHYGLDSKWESTFRAKVKRIMVIDDLANRPHDCDLLLDQNLFKNPVERYKNLVPSKCKLFLGPKHALLRSEFIEMRRNLRNRDGKIRRILIFYGGSDPTNETAKALEAVRQLNNVDIIVDVVVGSANQNKQQIKQICSKMLNVNYYCQTNQMAELMNQADLAFGAGGASTWERCYIGLPSIVTITAENQLATNVYLASLGAIWNLGWYDNITTEILGKVLKTLLENPGFLIVLEQNSRKIMESMICEGKNQLLKMIMEER